ncbi:UNVERIFIED_CONTAM: hypothetical protein RMT77_019375 [Armadillidium vulgare]
MLKENENDDEKLTDIDYITQNLFRERKVINDEGEEEEEAKIKVCTSITDTPSTTTTNTNTPTPVNAASYSNNKHKFDKKEGCKRKSYNDEEKQLKKKIKFSEPSTSRGRNFASLLYNVLSNENCILFPEADADKENFHFNLKSALTHVSRNDSLSHYFQTNGNFERKEKIEEEVVVMSNFPPPLFFSEAFASKFLRENKINIYAKAHKIFGKKTNFKMNSIKKLSEGKYELSKKHDPKLRMEDDFASISSPPPLSPSSSSDTTTTTTTTTIPLAHVENVSDTNCRNSEIFSSSSSRVLEEYAKEFSTFSSSTGRRDRLLYLVLNDDNGGDDDDNNNNNNENKDDDEEFKFRLLTPPLRENDSSFSTFLFPFDKTITNQNRVGEDIISQSGSNARQSKRIRVEIPTSFLHISYICEKELQKLLRIKGIEDGGGDNEETFLSYLKEKSKNFDTRIVVDENQQQQQQQEQYRKDIRNEGGNCRGDGDGVKIILQNNAINNDNNKSKNNKSKKYDALTDFLWQHDFEIEIEKQLAHLISMKGKHIKDSSIKVIKDIIRKYFYYNAVLYLCNDEINKNGKNENIFPPVPSNYLALKMFFFARGSHIGKKTFFHQLNTLKFYLFRALPKRNMNRILAENWYDREYSRNKIHLTGNLNFGQPKKNSLSVATIVSSLKFLFNTIKTGEKRMMMMMMRKMVPARGQKRKDHDHVNDDDDGDNGEDNNGNREGDDDDDGEIGNIKKVLRSHCRHLLFLYFGMVYFCRWSDINSVTLKSAIDLLHGLPLYLDSKASSTNVSLNEKTGERGTSHLKQRYPHILGLPTHILNLLGFNVVELNKLVRDVAKQKNRYTIGSALSETLISRVIVKNEETRTRLMKSVRTYNDSLNIVMGFDIGMPPLPPHNLLGNVYENDIPKCVENHYGFDAINYCKSRVIELMVKMKKDYSENKINDNNNNIIISPPPLLPHHHHHHLPPPIPELRFNQFFFPDGMKNESAAEVMATTGAAAEAEAEATTYKNYREARLLPPPPPPHHHHHHHSFKNPYSHHIQYPFYYEATGTKINSDEPVKYSVTKFWEYSSFNDIFVVFNESRLSLKKSTPKRAAAVTKEKRTSSSSISSSSSSSSSTPPLFYRVLNFGDLALYAIYILVHHCDYDLNDRIFPESYRGQEKFINNMVLCDYVNFGIPVISQNLRQRQRRQPSSWNFKNKSSSDCNNNNIKTNEDFENAVFFKKALKDRIEIAKLHLKTNSHAKSHIFRVSAFSMVVDSILNMIGKIREDNKAAGTFAKFFKLFGKIHLSHENLNTHLRYYNQYSAVQRVLSAKRGHFSTKKHLRASEKHDDKSKETLNEKALKMVAAAATAAAAANNNNNNIENENENDNNNTTNYISSIPFYISREKEEPKKDPVCASFWFVELYNEIASRKKTSNLKNINNKDNNIDNFDEKNRNLYLFSSSQYSINRADPDEQFWEMMFSNHFFLVDDFTLTPKIISIKKRDIINSMQSKKNCKIKNANQISKDNYNTKFKNEMFLNENSDIVLAEKAKELLKDEVVILCEKRVLHKNQVKDYKF